MSDSDLNALAHDFGISDSTMVNRMITCAVSGGPGQGRHRDHAHHQRACAAVVVDVTRAIGLRAQRGQGDEGLRAVLQTSIDTAQQMLDATGIAG